ncbi:MAG TPA: chemotaxis protein CheA [Actinomycetes bacterium]
MEDLEDVIREFLVESYENLDRLDQDLIVLEADPASRQTLASVFRTIHTIKGTCGFLGFSRLESVTHSGENLLSRLRDGRLALTPEIISGLLALVDAVREILSHIESTNLEGEGDYADLIARLDHLQTAGGSAPRTPPETQASGGSHPAKPSGPSPMAASPGALGPEAAATWTATADAVPREPAERPDPTPAPAAPEPSQPATEASGAADPSTVPAPAVASGGEDAAAEVGGATGAEEGGSSAPPRGGGGAHESGDEGVRQQEPRGGAVSESTVRVDVAVLDRLMNLVGELVLARNRLARLAGSDRDKDLAALAQRLSLITSELQDGVMKTRMQPIGNLFGKLPRVVRDLALVLGKQARIDLSGAGTELDRTIVEAIKDPLTHLVRNAVDHGIEAPDVRRAAGKPSEGRIVLRAYYEGGQVHIEIADDGGGIDLERVRRRAADHGLVAPEEAQRMSDREALDLVFLAGFSTAEAVTSLSGRGVGMDVVRTNVERIGGTVEVESRQGVGTTFLVKLPLTLAIVPALVVTCAGQRFAIPRANLVELVRLEGQDAGVELVHDRPVYRLRGRLLPLVRLRQELDLAGADSDGAIVVLQAGEQRFGLVVAHVDDSEEIVVKPVAGAVKRVGLYAGATIMGDGAVALILDVPALARRSGVSAEAGGRMLVEGTADAAADGDVLERLLVVTATGGVRVALPLILVDRLEEFPRGALELSGDGDVVQYQDRIMPLVRLPGGKGSSSTGTVVPVVVTSHSGRQTGLVVERIVDVVEQRSGPVEPSSRSWSAGCAILGGQVTELLDLDKLLGRPKVAPRPLRAPEPAEV